MVLGKRYVTVTPSMGVYRPLALQVKFIQINRWTGRCRISGHDWLVWIWGPL